MFERRQSYNQLFGPIFCHTAGSIKLISSRRNIEIEAEYSILTEEQLNKVIHELRVCWQEHLTLLRGQMPIK